MAFTVLFPRGDKWKIMKKVALRVVVDDAFEESLRQAREYDFLESMSPDNGDYLKIKENYEKVRSQLEEGRVYDFYSFKKRFRRSTYPLSSFNRFKVVGTLKGSGPHYAFTDGSYKKIDDEALYKICPFCSLNVPEDEINEHLKAELCNERVEAEGNQITVIFDRGIKTEYEKLVLDCADVKTLKKIVYDRTGISASKQDVYRGEVLLKNSDTLHNEIVVLKQKRREQKR